MDNRDTMPATADATWLEQVVFNRDGLVPAIAQDAATGAVLMMAWMNRESLLATVTEREAIYWSRSRGKLWRKGEESGHLQKIKDIRLDCDGDTILLIVEQMGGIACHTQRPNCFFNQLQPAGWVIVETPKNLFLNSGTFK